MNRDKVICKYKQEIKPRKCKHVLLLLFCNYNNITGDWYFYSSSFTIYWIIVKILTYFSVCWFQFFHCLGFCFFFEQCWACHEHFWVTFGISFFFEDCWACYEHFWETSGTLWLHCYSESECLTPFYNWQDDTLQILMYLCELYLQEVKEPL